MEALVGRAPQTAVSCSVVNRLAGMPTAALSGTPGPPAYSPPGPPGPSQARVLQVDSSFEKDSDEEQEDQGHCIIHLTLKDTMEWIETEKKGFEKYRRSSC